MKKTFGKIAMLALLLTIGQMVCAAGAAQTNYTPGDTYVCRVGESLILDLPAATENKIDTQGNTNWKIIKEMNYLWIIPSKADDVLILTVANYKGDKVVLHITSKTKEELPENPIKRIVIKEFPQTVVPKYAQEIVPVKLEPETLPQPAAEPVIDQADKKKQEEELQKQLQAEMEIKKQQEEAQQQAALQLAAKAELEKKLIEENEAKLQAAAAAAAIYNVNTETVKTEEIKETPAQEPQKTEEIKPDKVEPVSKKKNTDIIFDISGGTYKINKESKTNFAGEFVAATKTQKGLFAQFALSADSNSFDKKYGQSLGIGIESDKMGFGLFAFVDSLFIKLDQYKSTFHYQLRPAIRFKNNRFAISGFAALALSKDQYTDKDDPVDSSLGIFNTALNHYGINVEGILIPSKLFFQLEGSFAASKAYKLLLGIEYGITKNIGIYFEGSKTSYGDLPLLTNESFGNDMTLTAGLRFETSRANLSKQDQIAFPRDYPLIANVKKANDKPSNKLSITLTANPKTGKAPLAVGFTAVITGGVSPYTINWDYGAQTQVSNSTNSAFSYLKKGTYNAFITVKDATNQTAKSNIETIIVTEDGPSITHTILATAGANGSIAPAGSVTVADNGNQSFTITADTGYKISSVKVDGAAQSAAAGKGSYVYEFKNVTKDHTIAALFESNTATTHIITASAGANGSIAPSGSVTVADGGTQNFNITADSGYKISSVKVDGVDQSAAAGKSSYSYQFTNVTVNHEITAAFGQNVYTITVTAGANGSITPGTGTYAAGSNATFTIHPNTSTYRIAQILKDGSPVSISNEDSQDVSFNNIQENHTLSATFEIKTYTVTANPGANGSIAPSGTSTYNAGDNASFNVQPNSGYSITQILLDGSPVAITDSSGQTVNINNIQANHTLSATFGVVKTYTITFTRTYSDPTNPPCTQQILKTTKPTVIEGADYTGTWPASVTVNFTECSKTVLIRQVEVYVDNVLIGESTPNRYTFTNVQSNHTVKIYYGVKKVGN